VKRRLLLTVLTFSSLADSALAQPVTKIVLLGGASTNRSNYDPYVSAAVSRGAFSSDNLLFLLPDTNPVTANHARDFVAFQRQFSEFTTDGSDSVILFGYSAGGKFAAKLAQDNNNVKGLFLVDPVDGQPPFVNDPERFPTVLVEGSPIFNIPTVVVESGLGTRPGFLNVPCVSPNAGPQTFARFVERSSLEFLTLAGASHVDFLAPPIEFIVRSLCARGESDARTNLEKTLEKWSEFLENF
jgi:pimeloyl-ACP methyl ester carboxylesterase